MDPKDKEYILENIHKKSAKNIARDLGIKERKVKKYMDSHRYEAARVRHPSDNSVPQEKIPHLQKTKILIAVCVIIITVICAFLPAVNSGFLNWDDNAYVTNNIYIRHISPDNIKVLLSSSFQGTYQPVVNIIYLLEYRFFGLNAPFYHAVSILFHLFSCLLVFWVILLLGDSIPVSLVAALLFGLHPLRVESVAWVSEMKDVVYVFFFLWALADYCYYVKRNSIKYYYGALFLFLFSLGSKAMAATLPVVFFVVDYFFGRKFDKKIFFEKIPFFLFAFVFGIVAIYAQGGSLAVGHGEQFILSRQIPAAFYGTIMYIYKTILPVNLSLIYPYPQRDLSFYFICFSSAILILLIAGAAFLLRKVTRKVAFGLLFALITVLPVLQIVPIGASIMADRYTYLPSVGISYLASVGLFYICTIKSRFSAGLRVVRTIFLCIVLAALGFLTYKRAEAWKDNVTIFSDVIRKHPEAYMAYNNRGTAYERKNKFDEAFTDYDKSLQLNDNQFGVYNNRGNIYGKRGDFVNAIRDFEKAIQLNPSFPDAYNNLGNAYSSIGNKEQAIAAYKKAIELNPNYAQAYNNLGTECLDKNEAIAAYKKAIELNPYYAEAYYNLSKSYESVGRIEEAADCYKNAKRLNPNLP